MSLIQALQSVVLCYGSKLTQVVFQEKIMVNLQCRGLQGREKENLLNFRVWTHTGISVIWAEGGDRTFLQVAGQGTICSDANIKGCL